MATRFWQWRIRTRSNNRDSLACPDVFGGFFPSCRYEEPRGDVLPPPGEKAPGLRGDPPKREHSSRTLFPVRMHFLPHCVPVAGG